MSNMSVLGAIEATLNEVEAAIVDGDWNAAGARSWTPPAEPLDETDRLAAMVILNRIVEAHEEVERQHSATLAEQSHTGLLRKAGSAYLRHDAR